MIHLRTGVLEVPAAGDESRYDDLENEPTTDDNMAVLNIECNTEIESASITASEGIPEELSLAAHRETSLGFSPDPRTYSREQYVYSKRGDGNHAHYHMLSRKGNRKQQLAAARKRRIIEGGPGQ